MTEPENTTAEQNSKTGADPLDTLHERISKPTLPKTPIRTWSEIALLVALHRTHGNISQAARLIGTRPRKVKMAMRNHPEFHKKVLEEQTFAKEALADLLEDRIIDIALNGAKRTERNANGDITHTTTTDDARHLTWLLERIRSGEWHLATKVEHTGTDGGPIRFKFEMGETAPAEGAQTTLETTTDNNIIDGQWAQLEDNNTWDDAA